MKKLVTFRFDPDLLAQAQKQARCENRTLTNFLETVLRRAMEGASGGERPSPSEPGKPL